MKIRELIEALEKFDSETEIIMSMDPEGNGYSYLHCVNTVYTNKEREYSPEIYDEYDENLKQVICLWP